MKQALLFLFTIMFCCVCEAQVSSMDSLQGFNLQDIVTTAHQKNMEGAEMKIYIHRAKRTFISKKYNLNQPTVTLQKYNPAVTNNIPCVNEDFESFPAGVVTSSLGWTADQCLGCSHICTNSAVAMSTNTSAVVIYSTQITDPICGSVGTSPFAGVQLVKLNNLAYEVGRIRQTFPVNGANFIYSYAYKGVLAESIHSCCADAYLMFRFFDQSGNIISNISHTVMMGTPSCVATSSANWAASTSSVGYYYTPNWELKTVNLSPYINSPITVEVIASSCGSGMHMGYMYYDAVCSTGAIIANNSAFVSTAGAYTSCVSTATLTGLPGLSNYSWQGPSSSGVSGTTNSLITTSVSGDYTLTASLGSVVTTQTLALTVGAAMNASLSGLGTLCQGKSTILQVTGNGISTYSWSSASSQQSITVSPSVTTIYTVSASNTLGCISLLSHTINVLPVPILNVLTNTLTLCQGQSANLSTNTVGIVSYTWNTGVTNSGMIVSPTLTSVYSVTGTVPNGCFTSGSRTITVFPSPQIQILGPSTLCLGQTGTLVTSGISGNTYNWSTGSSATSITVNPSLTTVYNVTASTSNGCFETKTATVTIYPVPQLQVIASPSAICVGQIANLGVIGNNISTILWSTGATSSTISTTPSMSSAYSTTVTSSLGCSASQSSTVVVNPLPIGQLTSSPDSICVGETATLTLAGTNLVGYQWSGNQNTPSIVVSPFATSIYSVTFTGSHNCSSNASYQLKVAACTSTLVGISENKPQQKRLVIFPNPSDGSFQVRGYENDKVSLTNDIGQKISEFNLNTENNYSFKVSNLAKGIYIIRSRYGSEKVIVK